VPFDAPPPGPLTLVVAAPGAAPVDKPPSSPWEAAADAGTAIGRGSKKAGLATAGFFTRLGKGIAASVANGSDAPAPR
jgi:hypothetical protein